MKPRTSLLVSLLGIGLLGAATASAQNTMSAPAPAGQQNMPSQGMPSQNMPSQSMPSQNMPSNDPDTAHTGSATYNSAQGQLTVNSSTSRTPSTMSPPSFEQLSGGKRVITKDAANAYPPLANDWDYAAHGGGSISKKQYEAWLQHLN